MVWWGGVEWRRCGVLAEAIFHTGQARAVITANEFVHVQKSPTQELWDGNW